MFKLKVYKESGLDKGNLSHEEFFETFKEAEDRYIELKSNYFKNIKSSSKLWSTAPTVWIRDSNDGWHRIMGF